EEPHEPLTSRHELERPLAALVELDRVLDRLRLAAEGALAQELDDRLSRRRDRLAAQRGVVAPGALRVEALPPRAAERDLGEASVAADDLPERQPLLAPPLHVGRITEG